MPIEILQSYRFVCDFCHKVGPTYQNRPVEATGGFESNFELPPRWVSAQVEVVPNAPRRVTFACPDCRDCVLHPGYSHVREGE